MTILQAAAVVVLWRSGRFDTLDIARVVGVQESDICKLMDEVRRRERGPWLALVEGGST